MVFFELETNKSSKLLYMSSAAEQQERGPGTAGLSLPAGLGQGCAKLKRGAFVFGAALALQFTQFFELFAL